MAEKLAKGTFERLGKSIWAIGVLGLRDAIELAPLPATLTRPFHFGRRDLDIAIELLENPITGRREPEWMSAKITESVPYEPHPKYDLRTAKILELDINNRKKTYYTEVDISGEDDIVITPLSAAVSHVTHSTTDAWKTISRRTLTSFGPTEADYFLSHLATFAERLKLEL